MTVLITQDEMNAMPSDEQQKFVAVEALCRKRLDEITSGESEWAPVIDARLRYLATVLGVGKALAIEPVCNWNLPLRANMNDEYDDFVMGMATVTAQLMTNQATAYHANSIILTGDTKDRLYSLARHMRQDIDKLNLPTSRKAKLRSLLESFERDLDKTHLSLLVIGQLCLLTAGAIADVDGASRAIRDALSKIEQIVGVAKFEQDEAKQTLLPQIPKPKLIMPPRDPQPKVSTTSLERSGKMSEALEDDIPF